MTHRSWDEHYTRGHEAQGHDHGLDASPAELAGFLAGWPDTPRRALDLGCGTGADAVFLAEQGITTTGIDLSARALELARSRAERHGVEVDWLQCDVLDLPLDDACIDLVLDRGCLHHVDVRQHPRYAAEVARVLRPGGVLLVREMNDAAHHEHAVSEADLRAMVDTTPLSVRSVVTYGAARGGRTARTILATIVRDDAS